MATTFEATAMAVYLSLNVEVIDDQRGADFFAVPLLSLAWVLVIGWWCQSYTVKFQRRYAAWLGNLAIKAGPGQHRLAGVSLGPGRVRPTALLPLLNGPNRPKRGGE